MQVVFGLNPWTILVPSTSSAASLPVSGEGFSLFQHPYLHESYETVYRTTWDRPRSISDWKAPQKVKIPTQGTIDDGKSSISNPKRFKKMPGHMIGLPDLLGITSDIVLYYKRILLPDLLKILQSYYHPSYHKRIEEDLRSGFEKHKHLFSLKDNLVSLTVPFEVSLSYASKSQNVSEFLGLLKKNRQYLTMIRNHQKDEPLATILKILKEFQSNAKKAATLQQLKQKLRHVEKSWSIFFPIHGSLKMFCQNHFEFILFQPKSKLILL